MNIMWAVGINITSALLFETPRDLGGYGFSVRSVGYLCFTPIVAVIIGELLGNWGNDWLAIRHVKRHGGLFKPEARLPAIYPALVLMVPGLVLIGQALRYHLHWVALVFGWGMYVGGYMILSVAITAYALDAYPTASGEVSALLTFSRIIGGFAVGYFQLNWGLSAGYDVSFGIQGAVVGASLIIVILLHVYGERLRATSGALKV